MTEHDLARLNDAPAGPAQAGTGTVSTAVGYSRPRLDKIGSVVRVVQSGPTGNRNETYQGSYWSDR